MEAKKTLTTGSGAPVTDNQNSRTAGPGGPLRAIDRAEYPSWTLKMQIMAAAEAAKYRFNPFDVTKVWSHRDYPLITVGRIVLNRNPENYFAEVEQAAFNLSGTFRAGHRSLPRQDVARPPVLLRRYPSLPARRKSYAVAGKSATRSRSSKLQPRRRDALG